MRQGGELRGNSTDRRRRKEWLLSTFGNGVTCPCFDCGVELTYATLTVDRIVPGAAGGRYTRDNIRPACRRCNVSAWQPWQRFLSGEGADDPPVELSAAQRAELEEAYAALNAPIPKQREAAVEA